MESYNCNDTETGLKDMSGQVIISKQGTRQLANDFKKKMVEHNEA